MIKINRRGNLYFVNFELKFLPNLVLPVKCIFIRVFDFYRNCLLHCYDCLCEVFCF